MAANLIRLRTPLPVAFEFGICLGAMVEQQFLRRANPLGVPFALRDNEMVVIGAGFFLLRRLWKAVHKLRVAI